MLFYAQNQASLDWSKLILQIAEYSSSLTHHIIRGLQWGKRPETYKKSGNRLKGA